MITESEIIKQLSGSMLGDFPTVLKNTDARAFAINIFKKIVDIDIQGRVNSDLFYAPINANPQALAFSQIKKIDDGIRDLNYLRNTIIPQASKKIEFILNAETLTVTPTGIIVTPELRQALIAERARLAEVFSVIANIPTIVSTLLTD